MKRIIGILVTLACSFANASGFDYLAENGILLFDTSRVFRASGPNKGTFLIQFDVITETLNENGEPLIRVPLGQGSFSAPQPVVGADDLYVLSGTFSMTAKRLIDGLHEAAKKLEEAGLTDTLMLSVWVKYTRPDGNEIGMGVDVDLKLLLTLAQEHLLEKEIYEFSSGYWRAWRSTPSKDFEFLEYGQESLRFFDMKYRPRSLGLKSLSYPQLK